MQFRFAVLLLLVAGAAGELKSQSKQAQVLERLGRGASFEQKKEWKEAEAEYRPALALDPGSASLHFDLAYVLARQGKVDDAIAEFRESLRLDPTSAVAHQNLGAALHRKGDFDGAIAECRESLLRCC